MLLQGALRRIVIAGVSALALAGLLACRGSGGGGGAAAPAGTAPAITSADRATFTEGAPSSFTFTATGQPAPALELTGGLPAGVAFTPATGVLAGTPGGGSRGTYRLTVGAANGVDPDAVQAFTLVVAAPPSAPAITSADHATFTLGAAGSFTVTATGSPVPTLAMAGTLPAGVTFTPATGVLAGTPAPGSEGSYPLAMAAGNGVAPDALQLFTLRVTSAPVAPALTSAGQAGFEVGAAGSFTVTATGNPKPALAVTGALPAGVTFTPATGLLAGTPAPGSQGVYPLTFTAANGIAPDAAQDFTLTVAGAPAAPAITSAAGADFVVGAAGSFTVTATGNPPPALALAGTLPAGVSFTAASGLLAGTPAPGGEGSYPLTVTAANGVAPDAVQAFTLRVAAAPSAPAITSADHATFIRGAAGSFTVTATGNPPPVLAVAGTLPAGVTFTAATGLLAGTPAPGSAGNYPLAVTAGNGVAPDAAQGFTLTVAEPPSAPAITSADHAAFTSGSAGSFTVTATGNPQPVLAVTGALPAGLAFSPATGELAGIPVLGTQGVYPLSVSASNGVAPAASQAFTLTVADPPGTVAEFETPTADSWPLQIAAGADGNLWFTEYLGNKLGSVTPSGAFTEFGYFLGNSRPYAIAVGPDGVPWCTFASGNNTLGRITGGSLEAKPAPASGMEPHGLAAGPDGRLWFTEYGDSMVSAYDPVQAVYSRYPLPTPVARPEGIAAGPDGALWFTEYTGNQIGRITTAGMVTEFAIPAAAAQPCGIAAGPDGNLWFAAYGLDRVGRITPAGVITLFALPSPGAQPFGITVGPDGNLWCTESGTGRLARITTTGVVTEIQVAATDAKLLGIATGPDGCIWFTEYGAARIGRYVPAP